MDPPSPAPAPAPAPAAVPAPAAAPESFPAPRLDRKACFAALRAADAIVRVAAGRGGASDPDQAEALAAMVLPALQEPFVTASLLARVAPYLDTGAWLRVVPGTSRTQVQAMVLVSGLDADVTAGNATEVATRALAWAQHEDAIHEDVWFATMAMAGELGAGPKEGTPTTTAHLAALVDLYGNGACCAACAVPHWLIAAKLVSQEESLALTPAVRTLRRAVFTDAATLAEKETSPLDVVAAAVVGMCASVFRLTKDVPARLGPCVDMLVGEGFVEAYVGLMRQLLFQAELPEALVADHCRLVAMANLVLGMEDKPAAKAAFDAVDGKDMVLGYMLRGHVLAEQLAMQM